jgi:DNA-binding transcriptional MerR regulator
MCRLTRTTYRQLDYWVRTGIVTPSIANPRGSGNRRRWASEQVRVVRLVADLCALGATNPVLVEAVATAERMPEHEWQGMGFVDETGRIDRTPPGGSCWAVDLSMCSQGEPTRTASAVA